MRKPQDILQDMAAIISIDGLYRGEQLGIRGLIDRLDICAIAYVAAEWIGPLHTPGSFFADNDLEALNLIESSPGAMTAIRAISEVLDTPVDQEEMAPGCFVPNYISHVSNWARCTPVGGTKPPTVREVIARIHHAGYVLAT